MRTSSTDRLELVAEFGNKKVSWLQLREKLLAAERLLESSPSDDDPTDDEESPPSTPKIDQQKALITEAVGNAVSFALATHGFNGGGRGGGGGFNGNGGGRGGGFKGNCYNCGKPGHRAAECRQGRGDGGFQQ